MNKWTENDINKWKRGIWTKGEINNKQQKITINLLLYRLIIMIIL